MRLLKYFLCGVLFLSYNAAQAEIIYGIGFSGADRSAEAGGTYGIDPSKVYGVNLYVASTEHPDFSYKIGYLSGTQRYNIYGGSEGTAKYQDIQLSVVYDIVHSKSGWFLDGEVGVAVRDIDSAVIDYAEGSQQIVYGFGVGKMFLDKMFVRASANFSDTKYQYNSEKSSNIGTLQFDLTYWFI